MSYLSNHQAMLLVVHAALHGSALFNFMLIDTTLATMITTFDVHDGILTTDNDVFGIFLINQLQIPMTDQDERFMLNNVFVWELWSSIIY